MEKKKDNLEDLFRKKLYDFEEATSPDDWEKISARLDEHRVVTMTPHKKIFWAAAAAVVAILLLMGGIFIYQPQNRNSMTAISQSIPESKHKMIVSPQSTTAPSLLAQDISQPSVRKSHTHKIVSVKVDNVITERTDISAIESEEKADNSSSKSISIAERVSNEPQAKTKAFEEPKVDQNQNQNQSQVNTKAVEKVVEKVEKSHFRRWGFGMGGGSITTGANNSLNTYAFRNTTLSDATLLLYNSAYFDSQLPKTNVKHHSPLSFGLTVSYNITNNLALVSGVDYTFLSSEWETNGTYHSKTKQYLHFVGVPLALSWQFARWKDLHFYTSAGGMAEVNVAGRLKTRNFTGDELMGIDYNHIRMKKVQYSLDGRIGVAYPLWKFISLYGEAGASYYFDTGSSIETIRTEKPFNLNFQAGFRLGF